MYDSIKYKFEKNIDKIIQKIQEYNPNADTKLIKKAYVFAKKYHKGQKRESGEEFFEHPLAVANILLDLHASSNTICGALLHDVVEDTKVTTEKIREEFGEDIAEIIEGVTKIEKINFETKEDYKAENIRKILLATAKDVRVIILKLADRLHNMRTLTVFNPAKQKRIADETLAIYAPIAGKLGIYSIKGELEDLSFRFSQPRQYRMIANKINEKRLDREKNTEKIVKSIQAQLGEKKINAKVTGRAKYFHSIYKKMISKNKSIDEIYDLIAIRIITKTIPDCYAALGTIHEMWKPMPGRFKDFIAVPKINGYQSLHTVVIADEKLLEIQIRTDDMHIMAEEGVAVHWKYKGTERDKKFDRKVNWLKQVLEWQRDSDRAQDFIENLKIDLFDKEIVVFTPKGDHIALPEGSTPVDFAYEVHTQIGHTTVQSEINGRVRPLDTELHSGDIVKVMTRKNAKPNRQWLKFVKTSKARSKIKSVLNITTEHDPKHDRKKKAPPKSDLNMIMVTGKKAPFKLSRCCNPKFGEEIVGFYTKDKKITIHKKDCPNIHALDTKEAKVRWKKNGRRNKIKIEIIFKDRTGILIDFLTLFNDYLIDVRSVNTSPTKGNMMVMFELDKSTDMKTLKDVLKRAKSINNVLEVRKNGKS